MKHTPTYLRLNAAWPFLSVLPVPLMVYGALHVSIRTVVIAMLAQVPLVMLGGCITVIRFRRTVRAVRAARGRLCLRCGFDLTGLEERGVCPECGREYDVWASVKKWRSILNDSRGLDRPPPG